MPSLEAAAIALQGFLAAAVLLGVTAQGRASDWPMAGHDPKRSGFSPDAIGRPYKCLWLNVVDERIDGRVQPIIAGQRVFIPTTEGNLYALNLADGTVAWKFQAGGPLLHSPTFQGGQLYFGCQDGQVYAVQADTGKLVWTAPTGAGIWTSPVVTDQQVLIGSRDRNFYAFDRATGKELWRFATQAPIYNSPAYRDGKVYFASDDMHLYCLDAESGKPVWTSDKLYGQAIRDHWPVLVGDKVIITTTPTWPNLMAMDTDFFQQFAPPEGKADMNANIPRTAAGLQAEQQAMIQRMWADPARYRTFFLLDAATGKETVKAPVWYQGSWGGNLIPPLVTPDGKVYTFFRSRFTPWMAPFTVGWFRDFGMLDLRTGVLRSLIPGGGTLDRQRALSDDPYHLHFVTDEQYCTSGAGDEVFVSWSDHGLGIIDLKTGAMLGGLNYRAQPQHVLWKGKPVASEEALPADAGRHWTRLSASAAVSGKYMVYKYWSSVYCFEGK